MRVISLCINDAMSVGERVSFLTPFKSNAMSASCAYATDAKDSTHSVLIVTGAMMRDMYDGVVIGRMDDKRIKEG